ncbi:MAG: hypothetical protein MPJ50_06715 [Pirellulales bacterium]|nr:hypothetical protein [Pirellulales bacterium]
MSKAERAIVIILRVIGIAGLFATPAIFLPFSWMDAIHGWLGLGELPDVPIVRYLARSLSAFYAVMSVLILYLSHDVRRHRGLLKLWCMLAILFGFTLWGIGWEAGLPNSWTLAEGPPAVLIGFVVLWLQRKLDVH